MPSYLIIRPTSISMSMSMPMPISDSLLYFSIIQAFLLFVLALRLSSCLGLEIVSRIGLAFFLFRCQAVRFVGVFIVFLLLAIHLLSQLYIPNYLHVPNPILPQSTHYPITNQRPLQHLPQITKNPLSPILFLLFLNL